MTEPTTDPAPAIRSLAASAATAALSIGTFFASLPPIEREPAPRKRRYVLVCADGDERRQIQRDYPGLIPDGYDVCSMLVVRTADHVLRGLTVDGFELTQRARWSRWGLAVQQQLEELAAITAEVYREPATA
jgi:hypothetical protein